MGGQTKIDGTNFDISPGKVLLDGTAHNISQGKTKIGATDFEIRFLPEGNPDEPLTLITEDCDWIVPYTGYYTLKLHGGGGERSSTGTFNNQSYSSGSKDCTGGGGSGQLYSHTYLVKGTKYKIVVGQAGIQRWENGTKPSSGHFDPKYANGGETYMAVYPSLNKEFNVLGGCTETIWDTHGIWTNRICNNNHGNISTPGYEGQGKITAVGNVVEYENSGNLCGTRGYGDRSNPTQRYGNGGGIGSIYPGEQAVTGIDGINRYAAQPGAVYIYWLGTT